MERAEKRLAAACDLGTCTTYAELQTLQSFRTAKSTGWFPNGVDSKYFAPSDEPYDPNTGEGRIGRNFTRPIQEATTEVLGCALPLRFSVVPELFELGARELMGTERG